jgi:uncharacterized protein (DUF427 family)
VAKATWGGELLAESDRIVIVEGNRYFPPDSVKREYLRPSETHTVCPWKGTASYYDIEVHGKEKRDAAWFYADPRPAALQIKDYIAFWKGVRVEP